MRLAGRRRFRDREAAAAFVRHSMQERSEEFFAALDGAIFEAVARPCRPATVEVTAVSASTSVGGAHSSGTEGSSDDVAHIIDEFLSGSPRPCREDGLDELTAGRSGLVACERRARRARQPLC